MTKDTTGIYNLTKPVILAHPNLITARPFKDANGKEKGDPKYGCNFVLSPDHPDFAGLKAKAVQVARAKWPDRDLKELRFPFKDGSKEADKRKARKGDKYTGDAEYQRGQIVLPARSNYEPALAVIDGNPPRFVDLEGAARVANEKKFYFGCEVLAQVNFVAYNKTSDDTKDGVTAYLNQVVSLNRGKRLTSAQSAAETFKGYAGTVSAVDPTAGAELDDDIAF